MFPVLFLCDYCRCPPSCCQCEKYYILFDLGHMECSAMFCRTPLWSDAGASPAWQPRCFGPAPHATQRLCSVTAGRIRRWAPSWPCPFLKSRLPVASAFSKSHTHAYIDGHWCVAGSPLVPCLGCEDVVRNSWAVVTLHWHDGTHGLSELKWPRIATVTSCKTDYMWLFSKSVCRQTVCPVKPIRAAHGQDDFLPSNVALMHDHFKFSRPVNWKEPVVCAQAQAEDLSEWNTLVATTEILKQTAVAWCGVSNMTFAWVHAANVQPSIQRACSNCISWWTESSTFAWPQSSKIEGPPPPTLQLPPFVDPSTGKLQQLQEKEMVGLVYNKEPSTEVNPLPMGLPVSSEPTEPPPASEPPVEAKTPAIVSHQQMTILTKHLVLSNGALLRISFHTAWWPFRKKQVLRYI